MFKRFCCALVWLASVLCLVVWLIAIGAVAALVVVGLVATAVGYAVGNVVCHTPNLLRHSWPHGGVVGAYMALAGLYYFTAHGVLFTDLYLVLALAHAVAFRRYVWASFIHPLCSTWAKHCPCRRVLRFGQRVLGWMVRVVSKQ